MSYSFKIKNGDFELDNRGWVNLVGGGSKLAQEVHESLLNSSTSDNPLKSNITSYIGKPQTASTEAEFKDELVKIGERLKILQSTMTNLEPSEALDKIQNIYVNLSLGNVLMYFDLYSRDGSYVPVQEELVMNEIEYSDIS